MPFTIFLDLERGELTEPGVIARITFKAVTGHRGERPREVIFKIFTAFLDWSVLVHLTKMCAPGGGGGGGGGGGQRKYPP